MFQQAYYKLPPLVSASFSSHAILFPKKKSHRRLEGRFLIVAACGGFRRWKTPQVGTTKS